MDDTLKALSKCRGAYLFLLPAVLLLLIFSVSPIFSGIYMSFQKAPFRESAEFVGFRNYLILLEESRFINNITCTFKYLAGVLILSLPVAYIAALLISNNSTSARFFRAIFLLPWIMASVVSALLFRSMVDPSFGPITILLERITGKQYLFLIDDKLAMLMIIVHSAWRSFPVIMLFIASGIATIPPEVYEAAEMDGAGAWSRFRHITVPLTKTPLFIVLLLITAWTIQDAEGVYALTGGGPGNATEVTAVRLLKESFVYFNLGMGAGIAIILVILGIVLMITYLKILRTGES